MSIDYVSKYCKNKELCEIYSDITKNKILEHNSKLEWLLTHKIEEEIILQTKRQSDSVALFVK